MSFHFLAASTEVQVMIIEYITNPADLRALCLVSKEVSALAIPALYHRVDLTPRERRAEEQCNNPNGLEQIGRVESLLSNKKNLSFIRILITAECGLVVTSMLNELLENLRDDRLLELHYGDRYVTTNTILNRIENPQNHFPDPEQMALIWARQRKLQTLHSTHLFMLLESFKTNKLDARAIIRPVKELILISEDLGVHSSDTVNWLIKNVEVSALQKLKLVGCILCLEENFQGFDDLFAGNAFINLTNLFIKGVSFWTTLQLANLPSLESLSILYCRPFPDSVVMLSIPHPLKIKFLHFAIFNRTLDQMKPIASMIGKIQGLETFLLEMECFPSLQEYYFSPETIDRFRTELAYGLEIQQATLIELVVREEINWNNRLIFAGKKLLKVIQGCGKLRRLALPLSSKHPFPWYSRLTQDLPHLTYYWLMGAFNCRASGDAHIAERVKNAIPTESNLRFFAYDFFCYSRQERKDGKPTAQPELDGDPLRFTVTRINWKKANAVFYNRYPCFPLLPNGDGPTA